MPGLFAMHSLVVYRLWANTYRHKKDRLDVSNYGDKPLADYIVDFVNDNKSPFQVNEGERFIQFDSYVQIKDSVLVNLKSGRAGLRVDVVDTRTMTDSGISYTEEMAGMVPSRLLIKCTPGFGYALIGIESVPNGGGVTVPVTALKNYISRHSTGIALKSERVQEKSALDAFTGIEKFELRRYRPSNNIEDGTVANVGTMSFIANHKKGLSIPLAALDMVKDKKAVAEYFGVSCDYSGREEVLATLKQRDGKRKTFMLDKEFAVPITEVLNESGQPPLTDDEFIAACLDSFARVEDIFVRDK